MSALTKLSVILLVIASLLLSAGVVVFVNKDENFRKDAEVARGQMEKERDAHRETKEIAASLQQQLTLNATAAIAVAMELGLTIDQIRKALASFGGVKRRFTRTGEWNGVAIFDDYGHHPVEISAVLRAARA